MAFYKFRTDAARAVFLYIISMAVFSALGAIIRHLSIDGVHPFVVVFWRSVFGLAVIVPWLWRIGLAPLKTPRWPIYVVRGMTGILATMGMYYALSVIPLATVTAYSFTTPLFATLGVVLVLGERMRLRRMAALTVGFIGMLVLLRPGYQVIDAGILAALGGALALAVTIVIIKYLARFDSPAAIVAYAHVMILPWGLLLMAFYWQTPTLEQFFWLAAVGLGTTVSQIWLNQAFRVMDASALMPLDFVRLVVAAALGFMLFAEVPDIWTWIGGGIILASTAYIARRESRVPKAAESTPPVH